MNADAVDNAVGTGDIHILKQAKRGLFRLLIEHIAVEALVVDNDHFAGLYVADELSADGVDNAAFGSDDVAVVDFADTQRTEAVNIAEADKTGRRADDR